MINFNSTIDMHKLLKWVRTPSKKDLLYDGMNWEMSPQGHSYWLKIYILNINGNKEIKNAKNYIKQIIFDYAIRDYNDG